MLYLYEKILLTKKSKNCGLELSVMKSSPPDAVHTNIRYGRRLSKDKHYNLYCLLIFDKAKKFYNIDPSCRPERGLLRNFPNKSQHHLQLQPGVTVIKRFSFITDDEANKLVGFPLETLSSQVLEFEGKARINPIGAPFRCFLLG